MERALVIQTITAIKNRCQSLFTIIKEETPARKDRIMKKIRSIDAKCSNLLEYFEGNDPNPPPKNKN